MGSKLYVNFAHTAARCSLRPPTLPDQNISLQTEPWQLQLLCSVQQLLDRAKRAQLLRFVLWESGEPKPLLQQQTQSANILMIAAAAVFKLCPVPSVGLLRATSMTRQTRQECFARVAAAPLPVPSVDAPQATEAETGNSVNMHEQLNGTSCVRQLRTEMAPSEVQGVRTAVTSSFTSNKGPQALLSMTGDTLLILLSAARLLKLLQPRVLSRVAR